MDSIYVYIIFFISIFLFSLFLNSFFLKKSKKYTLIKANQGGIRWRKQSKPVFGGITFYTAFLFTAIAFIFIWKDTDYLNPKNIGFALIITLSFIMGLADDIINTSPYFKFFVQILNAVILINFDIYIDVFSNIYLNYGLTILWIVGIMNSINMLDNMDAITSLTIITIILGILANIFLLNNLDANFLSIILCFGILSVLIGFLFFNWAPSKLYMGDSGSQFLGAFIACISIIYIWNNPQIQTQDTPTINIIAIFLAFLIPLTDTTTVFINRLLKKKSPFVGGKDHTTHHLFYLGFNEHKIAIILFSLSLISVFFSVYLINFKTTLLLKIVFISYAFIVFLLLYLNTRFSKPKD